ncbi:N-acetylmuramoyl-L-alanine amidase [Oscillibacter hominis]|uniref:N-acetylmuramoyl-L-alanine amidase n=1 Tax=Oscillibacter hominis TaxID=2763056 RepID=A0A7G9B8G1_9FIRM|nr:N-acetylmuramoyl-L-alanine amidase [Oscillibacter hominis]
MVLIIRKKHGVLAGLFCLFVAVLAVVLWQGRGQNAAVFAPGLSGPATVVIDPGHGGEDGGAVASNGTTESGINLAVALRLDDVMRFLGHETVMTRKEDISVYTEGAKTLHEKKVSDLKNRVAQINGTAGAVLISIHQNSMPSAPSVHGAQAFYNRAEGSTELAGAVQESLNQSINAEQGKTAKKIPDSIYLMKHVTCPSVIVECGFLSNTSETERLQTDAYQTALAVSIAAGYQRYLANEGTE